MMSGGEGRMRTLVGILWRTGLLLLLELAVLWACGRGQPESIYPPGYAVAFSAVIIFIFAVVTAGRQGQP
jgi:hypothetical protein